jgi:hypothetical protein
MTEDIEKLLAYGRMGLETGQYEQAREDFEKVLALDPSNQEAMKGLARVNERLSRREAAAVEPIHGEPVAPPQKEPKGSPVEWFKRQSRLGKIAILAGVPLVLCCLCVGLAISAVSISLPPQLTPSPAGRKVTLPPAWTSIPIATATPASVATATPTFLREGETWVVGDLAVTILEHELTGCVVTAEGKERCPPESAAYLWVHMLAQHVGDTSALPVDASFSTEVFYRDNRQDDSYLGSGRPGKPHWPGHSDGSGPTELYSGTQCEGWLGFTVPAGIVLSETVVHLDNWRGKPKFEQDWILAD